MASPLSVLLEVSFASAAYAGLSFKDTRDQGIATSLSRASVGSHEASEAVLAAISGVLHSVLFDLLSDKILSQSRRGSHGA